MGPKDCSVATANGFGTYNCSSDGTTFGFKAPVVACNNKSECTKDKCCDLVPRTCTAHTPQAACDLSTSFGLKTETTLCTSKATCEDISASSTCCDMAPRTCGTHPNKVTCDVSTTFGLSNQKPCNSKTQCEAASFCCDSTARLCSSSGRSCGGGKPYLTSSTTLTYASLSSFESTCCSGQPQTCAHALSTCIQPKSPLPVCTPGTNCNVKFCCENVAASTCGTICATKSWQNTGSGANFQNLTFPKSPSGILISVKYRQCV